MHLDGIKHPNFRIWTIDGRSPVAIPEPLWARFAPARFVLYEWTEYWVETDGADELHVGDTRLAAIQRGLFRLVFENQLGLVIIRPFRLGWPLGEPVWAEVLSPKFPSLKDHLSFFGALLDDLFTRAARLPFAFTASTARGAAEAVQPPSPLFTYHFFCQYAAALQAACAAILSAPHRELQDRIETVPLDEVADVDVDMLLGILQSPENWTRAHGIPIAKRMHGYAPTKVRTRKPFETFDTPENRFVLTALRTFLANVADISLQSWWSGVSAERKVTIREAHQLLREVVRHPLFDQVGTLQTIPISSRVLQRREGYRTLFQLWLTFQHSHRPLFEQLHHAIDLRDIATLYESWAFFALLEEIAVESGESPAVEMKTSDERGLLWEAKVRFGATGTLVYNRTRQSYSKINMRPDLLWCPKNGPHVAFDAKFRLERTALEPDNPDLSKAQAKHDDLYRMHTYRDGLGLRAAVCVYPGDISAFYEVAAGRRPFELGEVLFGQIAGVGAASMSPVKAGLEEMSL